MTSRSIRKRMTTGGAVVTSGIVSLGLVVTTPDVDDASSEVRPVRLTAAAYSAVPSPLLQILPSDRFPLIAPAVDVVGRDPAGAKTEVSAADVVRALEDSTPGTETTTRSLAVDGVSLRRIVHQIVGGVVFVGVLLTLGVVVAIIGIPYRVVEAIRNLLSIPPITTAVAAPAIAAAEPEPTAVPSLKSAAPTSQVTEQSTTAQVSTSDAEDEVEASEAEEPRVRSERPRPLVRASLAFGERLRGLLRRDAEPEPSSTQTEVIEAAESDEPQVDEPASVGSPTHSNPSGDASLGGDNPSGGDDSSGGGDGGAE